MAIAWVLPIPAIKARPSDTKLRAKDRARTLQVTKSHPPSLHRTSRYWAFDLNS